MGDNAVIVREVKASLERAGFPVDLDGNGLSVDVGRWNELRRKAAAESAEPLRKLANLGAGTPVPNPEAGTVAKSLAAVREAAQGKQTSRVDVERKALLDVALPPAVRPTMVTGDYPSAAPSILGLFAQETTTAAQVRVYRSSSNATAAQVAEGARKPDAGLTSDHVDIDMVKIATTQKFTDEFIDDAPSFFNQVPQELANAVAVEENNYAMSVLNAASGLVAVDASTSNILDGVADATAELQSMVGIAPDSIVLNPLDLAKARKERGTTDGQYLIDPLAGGPSGIHGLRYVVSNSVAQNTVFVGSFRSAGMAFTREALSILVRLTEDDFMTNHQTLRLEERVALGLTRPGHLVQVSLAAA